MIASRRAQSDSSAKYSDLLQVLSDTRLPDGKLLPAEIIPFGTQAFLLSAFSSDIVSHGLVSRHHQCAARSHDKYSGRSCMDIKLSAPRSCLVVRVHAPLLSSVSDLY